LCGVLRKMREREVKGRRMRVCEQTDGVARSYYVYSFGKQKAERMIRCKWENHHTIPAWHAHAEILRVLSVKIRRRGV